MSTTKTVVITGAGGSLGRALTAVFARDGYAIAGVDIDKGALDRFSGAAEAEKAPHLPVACDLRDWRQIEKAVAAIVDRFGRIDVIINNATARTNPNFKPIEDNTDEEVDAVFGVGPRAALGLMRTALPQLKESKGLVINIGSGAGLAGREGLASYSMAKAALHALTYVSAKEWGPHGVRVNGILPFMLTEKLDSLLKADPNLIKTVAPALGRIGHPEKDVAGVALFLASPAAAYITGQNISVDGGNNMR
jgi:NAD(P)-dependent dehydrogenase (short-subunit alcohol dehydrogenase family)